MLPILQIGPLALPTQPFLILVGIWLGLWLSEKRSARLGIDPNRLSSLVLLSLGLGLLGARLGFVLRHLDAFSGSPLNALAPSLQMLDLESGLLAGGLTVLVYAQRHQLSFWPLLDALTPGLAVFAVLFWLAAFAAGDAYGLPSDLPWAVSLWDAPRHPVQLYAAAGAGLAAVLSLRGKPAPAPAGTCFLTWGAWSAASLLLVEAWRADPTMILFGSLRIGQVLAWIGLAACLVLIGNRNHKKNEKE